MTKRNQLFFFMLTAWIFPTLLAIENPAVSDKYKVHFEQLPLDTGLSQSCILAMAKDRTGFMWFATLDGLNRFDGYEFKVYSHDPGNPDSLPDNRINALHVDRRGQLWVGTQDGGAALFIEQENRFKIFSNLPNDPTTIGQNHVFAFFEDQDGFLWLGLDSEIDRYDPNKGTFQRFPFTQNNVKGSQSNFFQVIQGMKEDSSRLWIGAERGLFLFDVCTARYIPIQELSTEISDFSEETVFTLYEPTNMPGTLLVGTSSGLYNLKVQASPDLIRENPTLLLGHSIRSICLDENEHFWIGTSSSGIHHFSNLDSLPASYRHDPKDRNSIGSDSVFCLLNDNQYGVIWIGTCGVGINRILIRKKQFNFIRHDPMSSDTINSSNVRSLHHSRSEADILWVGTQNSGLNRLDRSHGKCTSFLHDPNDSRSLAADTVNALFEDPSGSLWIGTSAGVSRLDPGQTHFINFLPRPNDTKVLNNGYVYALMGDQDGDIWIGTRGGGLNHLKPSTGQFWYHLQTIDVPQSASLNSIQCLLIDLQDSHIFWLGTRLGLTRFDSRTGEFQNHIHGENVQNGISHNQVSWLWQSPHSPEIIWVGTYGGGLNRFNSLEGTFRSYTKQHGLPSNIIYGILEEKPAPTANDQAPHSQILWLSTGNGLCRFDSVKGTVQNYGLADGVEISDFNRGSVCYTTEGEFFFGGSIGVINFWPERILRSSVKPPVIITRFNLFNQEYYMAGNISSISSLRLSHRQNFFSIEFSALDFTNPEKNRYSWKMEGIDQDWVEQDARKRIAVYTSVTPGEYLFRLKGSNSDGVWNETETHLAITIVSPFWQRTWFRILVTMVLIGIALLLMQLRMHQIQRHRRILSQLVNERTAELTKRQQELERINAIVKIINSEYDIKNLLRAILTEVMAMEGVDKATVLAYDKTINAFRYTASIGWEVSEIDGITLSLEEVKKRYITQAQEVFPDIFVINDFQNRYSNELINALPIPAAMLAICIHSDEGLVAILIFDNMTDSQVFSKQNLELLQRLRDHIASAVIKSRLLADVEKEKQVANLANQAKSMFLARMSHEIRTPMNGVLGFADLLQETGLTQEQLEYVNTINRSGQALMVLINDILDITKIEAGMFTMESIDFDPEITVFDVCELMQPRIDTDAIEILCHIGDDVPQFVFGDPTRFRQVLMNLMGNAVKFTSKGELALFIEVEEETENELLLHSRIKDTGIGIPTDKLETIFEIFRQADESTTRQFGGTGLGLSISRQIARLMRGDVWAESLPGQGSTFHFTARLGKSSKVPNIQLNLADIKERKVLVVDDNPSNVALLQKTLTRAGMRVASLYTGVEVMADLALASESGDPFDLGILDIQMPGRSGYQVAMEIRASNTSFARIPLLAFSSSTSRQAREIQQAGFDGFLPKPFQREKLLKMVQHLLGKSEQGSVWAESKQIVTRHTLIEDVKHSVCILVAEDNPINQSLIRFTLGKAGYQMEIVTDGAQAVATYSARPETFDLILMDVQMPVLDGLQASRELRRAGYTVPIIAMTANALEGDREKCLDAGMSDYLSKPIKREEIFAMLKKWAFSI